MFLKTILKIWNILNVKTVSKGIIKRLEDSYPNVDLNDSIIEWMT